MSPQAMLEHSEYLQDQLDAYKGNQSDCLILKVEFETYVFFHLDLCNLCDILCASSMYNGPCTKLRAYKRPRGFSGVDIVLNHCCEVSPNAPVCL